MPIYEYICNNEKCSNKHEDLIFSGDVISGAAVKCILCGSPMKKIISKTSFNIKGEPNYKPLKESKPKSYVPDKVKKSNKKES